MPHDDRFGSGPGATIPVAGSSEGDSCRQGGAGLPCRKAGPVLLRVRTVLVGTGANECCATTVNPAVGVTFSTSAGLASETCMTTTAAEHPQAPTSLLGTSGVCVFHFCQARLLELRMLQAASALLASHGP